MDKIKNMFSGDNMKGFFLKHGEKVVLGFVALFVLMSLAKTQWTTYTKKPAELTQNLQSADQVIEGATYPQQELEKYPDFSPKDQVQSMLANMSSAPYNTSTPFWTPPGGQKEPIRESFYETVTDLIALPGRTLLAQSLDPVIEDEDATGEEGTLPGDEPSSTDDPDGTGLDFDDVAKRKDVPRANRGGGGIGEEGPGMGGAFEQQIIVQNDPNAFIMPGESIGVEGPGSEGPGMGGGIAQAAPTVKGVPVRYNSVLGIFDYRKQIQNYARAMQIDEVSAESLVEFIDFKLERQVALSPTGPWDAEWEPVNLEVAKDYVRQAIDWDLDPVPAGVRNTTITMPLPARLLGVWKNKVNHPRIKKFELSESEMEAEAALNRKIMDDFRKSKKAIVQKIAPGGFASLQLDMGRLQGDFMGATTDRQLSKTFEDEFKGTPDEIRKKMIEQIKDRVTATGSLMLFRYIDFDIEPGKSYRYRVKLVLRNPNFGTPVDQVNTPSVVEGQVRETPLSGISTVATVPEDYAYFLTRVEPPRGITNELAKMTIYKWFGETGTMITDNLAMELGDYIGGKGKTHVLRPAEMKFEDEEDVPFITDDILVDALQVGKLNSSLHSDLKLPRNLTKGDSGIPSEALVIDFAGRFKTINSISDRAKEKKYAAYNRAEKLPFEPIKDALTKAPSGGSGSSLFGNAEEEGMEEMSAMMGVGTQRLRGRKGNSSRLRGKRGAGSGAFRQ